MHRMQASFAFRPDVFNTRLMIPSILPVPPYVYSFPNIDGTS